jgi:MSHA pilin protein MshC
VRNPDFRAGAVCHREPVERTPAGRRDRGFTVVELVTTLVIVGIVAAFAAPRFFAVDAFEARGFSAEARAAIAFAQKIAIASGCDIRVAVDAGGYAVEQWQSACNPADHSDPLTEFVQSPAGGDLQGTPPGGVAITGGIEFYFDRIGRPRHADSTGELIDDPALLRAQVGGRILQVEPETGYVREL